MNLRVTDRQLDGAVVIVVIVVFIYVSAYFLTQFQSRIHDIPYGDKSSGPVIVAITGDTEFNGVYYLHEKAKVADLLTVIDPRHVDGYDKELLYTRISTGNVVIIETGDQLKIGEMFNANKVALNIPININKASQTDLMLIPGIGEKTALKIIQLRERSGRFNKIEDLMKIRGIKEKKFIKIKKYFYTDEIS
jgi:competence protein ComEA